jgi:hypothetical protein
MRNGIWLARCGESTKALRAPHPAFLANKVFEVLVAAVVKLNTAFPKLDDGQSAKLEV